MGEYADMMLEGDACAGCGMPFLDDEGEGFPRYCSRTCEPEDFRKAKGGGGTTLKKTTPCPGCARKLRGPFALAQHRAMKGH